MIMGSAFTTLGGDPIPSVDDQVAVPADILAYAEAIGHKIIHWVTDQSERDSLYANAAAPVWVGCPTALWVKISGSGGSSVWATLWEDTGPVTAGIVAGSNFQYASGYCRKIGKNAFFSLGYTRKVSTITINAYNSGTPGNITGDPVIFTLPTAFWPDHVVQCTFRGFNSNGVAEVNLNGTIELLSGTPSAVIAVDDIVIVSAAYMVP
jgi:hypothetical protein